MEWAAVIHALRNKGFSDQVIARYAKSEPDRITLMAKGRMTPNSVTGRLLKQMEFRTRGLENIRTEAEALAVEQVETQPKVARGVYEWPVNPEGYTVWQGITSKGVIGVQIMVHHSMMGQRDIAAGLKQWLNAEDPILRVMHGDGPS